MTFPFPVAFLFLFPHALKFLSRHTYEVNARSYSGATPLRLYASTPYDLKSRSDHRPVQQRGLRSCVVNQHPLTLEFSKNCCLVALTS